MSIKTKEQLARKLQAASRKHLNNRSLLKQIQVNLDTLTEIQVILFMEQDGTWNPEKACGADEIGEVCNLLLSRLEAM